MEFCEMEFCAPVTGIESKKVFDDNLFCSLFEFILDKMVWNCSTFVSLNLNLEFAGGYLH